MDEQCHVREPAGWLVSSDQRTPPVYERSRRPVYPTNCLFFLKRQIAFSVTKRKMSHYFVPCSYRNIYAYVDVLHHCKEEPWACIVCARRHHVNIPLSRVPIYVALIVYIHVVRNLMTLVSSSNLCMHPEFRMCSVVSMDHETFDICVPCCPHHVSLHRPIILYILTAGKAHFPKWQYLTIVQIFSVIDK